MTEQEWLESSDPAQLIKWIGKSKRHKPSRRKMVMFSCACAARVLRERHDDFFSRSLDLAERFVEGLAGEKDYHRFLRDCRRTDWAKGYYHVAVWAVDTAWEPEYGSSTEDAAINTAGYAADILGPEEKPHQCTILRDILRYPDRTIKLDPRWLTSNVVELARSIYQERAFFNMPILVDALMDAGCDNADILDHCKSEVPHVRGCWLVDLILSKQ